MRLLAASALAVLSAACTTSPPPSAAPSATATTAAPAEPPASAIPAAAPRRQTDTIPTAMGDIRVTPLYHATFLLEVKGAAIYFDPTKDAHYEGLPKADAVFITDIHPDHLDPKGLDEVMQPDTVIVAPPAVAEKLPKTATHVVVLKNGEKTGETPVIPKLGAAFQVEAVPMYNKTRGPAPGKLYHDKGRGDGYVLTFGKERFYVSGDTECTDEMKALQNIDVAFVCMNLPYTMTPSEAAECVAAFKPKILYPYHYRGQNPEEAKKALAGQPVDVRLRNWY